MHRNTNGSCLVSNRPGYRLTDPPGRIGTEFEAFFMVKLLNRFNQAHITFLNQIEEQHPTTYISFGNADYKPKICFCKPALSLFIAVFNTLGQFHFIICGKERYTTDFLQVHTNRIINFNTWRKR
ncbi:hypothetical protein D3C81_1623480 [compost metagenome]